MDSMTFDGITRNLGSTLTRRSALRGFVASAAALVAGGAILQAEDAAAKRRKKGKKGTGQTGQTGAFLPSGALCQSDSQCNVAQDHQICEVPQNASNSDHRCCGAQGAVCGGVNDDGDFIGPLCCIGEAGVRSFVCSQSDPNTPFVQGTCIPNPSED
jgi:uncharacterized membrane protein